MLFLRSCPQFSKSSLAQRPGALASAGVGFAGALDPTALTTVPAAPGTALAAAPAEHLPWSWALSPRFSSEHIPQPVIGESASMPVIILSENI